MDETPPSHSTLHPLDKARGSRWVTGDPKCFAYPRHYSDFTSHFISALQRKPALKQQQKQTCVLSRGT